MLLKNFATGTPSKEKNILLLLVGIFWLFPHFTPAVMAYTSTVPDNWSQTQYEKYLKQYENSYPVANTTPATSPTPTPTPTYIAKNDIERQQLQLLHQIQNGTLSPFNALLLAYLLNFPLIPIGWKLGIYNFITHIPFLSSIHITPFWFTILIIAGPFGIALILFTFILLVKKIVSGGFQPILPLIGNIGGLKGSNGPKTFLELTFPTNTTKSAYATEQLYKLLHTLSRRQDPFAGFLHFRKTYSLEIAASRDLGIRYILVVPKKEAEVIHRSLLSFLPGLKVKEVSDYLNEVKDVFEAPVSDSQKKDETTTGVVELKLSDDFTLPLQDQKALAEHDPISFLTGNMTKLEKGELVAFQIVTSPMVSAKVKSRMQLVKNTIYQQKPLSPVLFKKGLPLPSVLIFILSPIAWVIAFLFKLGVRLPHLVLDPNGPHAKSFFDSDSKVQLQTILNPYEQELSTIVKEKLSQNLFETSMRLLIVTRDNAEFAARANGLYAALGPFTSEHQSLTTKRITPLPLLSSLASKRRLVEFSQRTPSAGLFNKNPIISTSEISDLYHFPYTDINKVEGLVKHKSKDLPAPLSMKKSTTQFDVVIGLNEYGGEVVPIGLTLEQRERHSYVIGKTGMGKTEMLKSMIYQDMVNGKGLAVLDPHGDLFYELLRLIPKNRREDVVVFNPADKQYPVGLNILSSGISFSDVEEGQDKIVSTTLAIFQKITDEKYWGPRLEHILRNTTQTSLFTPAPSFWVVQKLLTSSRSYQKEVAGMLKDPVLKQFWESEFALYGKMQQSEAISPITNRIGKFITSHMSRNILLQPTSTFNIQKVMDEGKILLVNLSKGELGEDQSHFFGSLIISLIQLAAYERIHVKESERRNFFLYVDEFQNFATHIFEDLSSEGRKWHVPLIPSHQNIAQIKDPNLLHIVAGNADSFIAMKAGPADEKFILPFMEPEVEKGEIINLSLHHFFMKTTTDNQEDAFSGVTKLLDIKGSDEVAKEVIEFSRAHYATPRKEVEAYLEKLFQGEVEKKKQKNTVTKNTPDPPKSSDKNDKLDNAKSMVSMTRKPPRKDKGSKR